jgi:putative DNA-invertase from lambdoid prophage Rac
MKAALYLRVSTNEQDATNQLLALEGYAERHHLEIHHVYKESATAWKRGHQAQLSQLLEDARAGHFQLVLVWALYRLSREGPLAILRLVDRLKGYGVKVVSYQESWTEAPGDLADILYAITGWVARMESQRISERTKLGMARARAEGKPIGQRGPDKRKRQRRTRRELALSRAGMA